ncbi:MAG TPA: hypothetical protein VJ801_17570 [Polyangia bacterium]|nr:hypothetical protein [Polyangia bacterium]
MKTLLGILSLALACTPIQPQPTPAYDCGTVCAHGRELGCDWGQQTIIYSCLSQCAWLRDNFFYSMECMSTIATCAAAEACNEYARPK